MLAENTPGGMLPTMSGSLGRTKQTAIILLFTAVAVLCVRSLILFLYDSTYAATDARGFEGKVALYHDKQATPRQEEPTTAEQLKIPDPVFPVLGNPARPPVER